MIDIAHSANPNPHEACASLAKTLYRPGMELLLFFCSSHYDLDALAEALNRDFPGVQMLGCTTAGEIAPSGYGSHGMAAIGFSGAEVKAATGRIEALQGFDPAIGRELTQSVLKELEGRAPNPGHGHAFALMLIDGLSQREEPVTRAVQKALGGITLVGGSAGDDLRFRETRVFHDGRFHKDAAVIAVIDTTLPFKVFKTQHFVHGEEKLVVTEADTATRTIREINGLPAAEEYARIVGIGVDELDAGHFAAHPVLVRINGVDFVRSIQKANPDRSLTFYCAIDEGIVLTVASGLDPVGNLQTTLAELKAKIGPPQLVIVYDCILRNLEIHQQNMEAPLAQLFGEYNVLGFCTYGEQFCGVHVNQTLTGIAIGHPGKDDHD